jgi:hypothetical protein
MNSGGTDLQKENNDNDQFIIKIRFIPSIFTITEVKSLYNSRPDLPRFSEPSNQLIRKLLKLGKFNIEEWYGVKQDPNSPWFEKIFNTIKEQIYSGEFDHHINHDDKGNSIFIPDKQWINAPIYNHKYKKMPGYLFDNSNKTDLMKYLKIIKKDDLPFPKLYRILQTQWDVKWKESGFKHNDKVRKAIWIARSNFLNTEISEKINS